MMETINGLALSIADLSLRPDECKWTKVRREGAPAQGARGLPPMSTACNSCSQRPFSGLLGARIHLCGNASMQSAPSGSSAAIGGRSCRPCAWIFFQFSVGTLEVGIDRGATSSFNAIAHGGVVAESGKRVGQHRRGIPLATGENPAWDEGLATLWWRLAGYYARLETQPDDRMCVAAMKWRGLRCRKAVPSMLQRPSDCGRRRVSRGHREFERTGVDTSWFAAAQHRGHRPRMESGFVARALRWKPKKGLRRNIWLMDTEHDA